MHGVRKTDPARSLARDWLAEVRQGHDPGRVLKDALSAPTVDDLAERYLVEHAETKKRPGSVRMDRTNLRLHVLPVLGARQVQAITREDLADMHHKMRGTPGAANRVLSLCSKMFNLAEFWGMQPVGSNPARGIERYPGRKMERYLTGEELARLGEA